MLRIIYVLSLLTFSISAQSDPLPRIPSNCFESRSYCLKKRLKNLRNYKKVVQVSLFARFSKESISSSSALMDKYFDFHSWPKYADRSKYVRFKSSRGTFERRGSREIRVHTVDYKINAGIIDQRVVDQVEYVTIKNSNTIKSVGFSSKKGFSSRKGVKNSWGEVHIQLSEDGKYYIVLFENNIVPSISVAPKLALKYISRAMVGILKGMFDL